MSARKVGGRWVVLTFIEGAGAYGMTGYRFRSLSEARRFARRRKGTVRRYRSRTRTGRWQPQPAGWALAGLWRSPFIFGLKSNFAVAT